MRPVSNLVLGLALMAGIAVPDLAASMPRGDASGGSSPVVRVQSNGVLCDEDGCRTYGESEYQPRRRYGEPRRRIYVDPPEDEPGYYNDEPDVYVRPRVQRRIFVEPRPPEVPSVYEDQPAPRGLSRRHVRWCVERYRSYSPRTNLYLARRNVFRQCVSPYS